MQFIESLTCFIYRGEVGDSLHSSVRQDSASEYSNMSEPDKLEIDTKETGKAEEQENEVSNVCTVVSQPWERLNLEEKIKSILMSLD